MLLDGRRPLRGEGVPRGDVGSVLRRAPSDVAVLVAREDAVVAPGPDAPLVVPFGGAEHDWAALELGAWLAAATGAPLRLLGAAGDGEERRQPPAGHRLAARAALRRRRRRAAAGRAGPRRPPARPRRAPGCSSSGSQTAGARRAWGPSATRSPRAAPAPILFVRRGLRPGALAPRTDVTQFTWSHVGAGMPACRDQAGSPTRGGAWCTPDGAGRLRSSAGIWLTDENSRTSRISPGRARRLGGQQRHRLELGRHRPARRAELAGVLDPAQREDREDDDLGPDRQRPAQPEEPHGVDRLQADLEHLGQHVE